jgi:hypothetical protein
MNSRLRWKTAWFAVALLAFTGMVLAGGGRRTFELPEPIVIEGRLFAGETLDLVPMGSGQAASLWIDGVPVATIWTCPLLRSGEPIALRLGRGRGGLLHVVGFCEAAVPEAGPRRELAALRVAGWSAAAEAVPSFPRADATELIAYHNLRPRRR